MTPQLSVQQLEHAIKNLQRRVDAKKLETHSYAQFRDHAPRHLGLLLGTSVLHTTEHPGGEFIPTRDLQEATENFFTAKLNQALIDLEELELKLKAVKQMSSVIVVPEMQVNQNQR